MRILLAIMEWNIQFSPAEESKKKEKKILMTFRLNQFGWISFSFECNVERVYETIPFHPSILVISQRSNIFNFPDNFELNRKYPFTQPYRERKKIYIQNDGWWAADTHTKNKALKNILIYWNKILALEVHKSDFTKRKRWNRWDAWVKPHTHRIYFDLVAKSQAFHTRYPRVKWMKKKSHTRSHFMFRCFG